MATRLSPGRQATPEVVFGRAVARERHRRAWMQADLAEAAGLHLSQVSRFERGQTDLRLSTMVRLATALDVQLSALVNDVPAPALRCDHA